MGWNALILRKAGGRLGQQDENFAVNVDAGRVSKEVGLEVVHPPAPVADRVEAVDQELGGNLAERLIAAGVDRDECPPDSIHAPLIDRVFDRAEVEIDPAGVALQSNAVKRWHQVADVFLLDRLIGTLPRVLRCACCLVADLSAELIEYSHCVLC